MECQALEEENCQQNHYRYYERASLRSLYERSMSSDLDMAQDLPLTMKENSFPVAYVITAYMDPRKLGPGSVIVKLTRPHYSYCVHVDPSSDSMFR